MENWKSNIPPFYIGQKVIGILNRFTGKTYIVKDIIKQPCGCCWGINVGTYPLTEKMECALCGKEWINTGHYDHDCFAPIQESHIPSLTLEKIKETEKEEILIPN